MIITRTQKKQTPAHDGQPLGDSQRPSGFRKTDTVHSRTVRKLEKEKRSLVGRATLKKNRRANANAAAEIHSIDGSDEEKSRITSVPNQVGARAHLPRPKSAEGEYRK